MTMAKHTPMMQQYLSIKADYKDAFLFFRLGDFYEMFFDDAVKAAHELEITLTSRDGGDERIPMCGVPYHAAKGYIETLVERGYKVAVCEQVEDPKVVKGIVRREVVQLITPGTMMERKTMDEKSNTYIVSVADFADGSYGIACTDLTTGENTATLFSGTLEEVILEVHSLGAKELVVSSTFPIESIQKVIQQLQIVVSIEEETIISDAFQSLVSKLTQTKLKETFGRLLNYLLKTQKRSLDHLQPVELYDRNQFMRIDVHSKRNLELTETIRSKGKNGSLLWLVDKTKTAMGGRLLKQWIDRPLISRIAIEQRHHMVETLQDNFFIREDMKESLKEVYDLERLAGKVAFGNVNARDLMQLKRSLMQIPTLKDLVAQLGNDYADHMADSLDACPELTMLLEHSIKEDPPLSIKDGDIIKQGYNEKLDEYRFISKNGKTWISELERKERELTGIKSLKIGYNRIFGYYIEVTKSNLSLLQEGRYERKQTLANAERFITEELKEKEAMILGAEEKIVQLEYDLFVQLREQVKTFIPRLQKLAKIVSELDVLQSFATVSEENHFVKPVLTDKREVFVKDGRHPVVEKVLESSRYVPNDCVMADGLNIFLITGPNMSGKSTYMRQIALISILNQIGCYVPATEAVLPVFDQIFTRIGAADDLISGQSTFMVEMLEANNAIAHATERSLILFDEIGRGTSTYDGIALAQAIIEHIHEHIGAKTLFSTHYHELTALEEELHALKNVHVSAIEEKGKVVFLHKIKEGAADKSYGIHVAELANLPKTLINRAQEVLNSLEQDAPVASIPAQVVREVVEVEEKKVENPKADVFTDDQLSFFNVSDEKPKKEDKLSSKEKDVLEMLRTLDLLDTTPLDAINALYAIQKKLKK
jgi:DNA mismatch repair protein MutS